ncbi:hypothetical protein CWT12_06455 [Actinomyces sp. 432]|uniref:hypothetical protein n=1 Tax=Actinomyces sp. 432 TaxID=2057798 RepID=UPI00137393EF|nr:hypothetical protein [Actinomyces sp. 432]QHO91029.1 hypothetical protein CWT12_06455 [Actinomyces sp. 432]
MSRVLTPVVRVRAGPGTTDRYGERVPGPDTETDLPPALLAPAGASVSGATSEPVAAGVTTVLSAPTLYWRRAWPDVLASDRLRVHGTTYRVEGAPARWPSGLVVTLAAATDPHETSTGPGG